MGTALRIPEETTALLAVKAKTNRRSMSGQADYYIRLAMLVEDNPDLSLQFLKDVLEGREEIRAGLGDEYVFGTLS
jgi:hypothetical protein